MAAVHIPAWQKLGLKLKNQSAPFSPASPANDIHAGATPLKRKFDAGLQDETGSPSTIKKAKKDSKKKKLETNGTIVANGVHEASPPARDFTNGENRRKSVTFAADTKEEDGDSSKRLVQAAYASRLSRMTGLNTEQIATAGEELQAALEPLTGADSATEDQNGQSREEVKNGKPEEERKNGEVKTKKPKKPSAQPSSKVEAARQRNKREHMLEYLEQYKNSRESWKFNKSRQTSILKSLFDLEALPVGYDESLKMYIAGLQGTNLRRKLKHEAEEVLAKNSEVEDVTSRAQLVLDAIGDVPDEEEPKVESVVRAVTALPQMNGTHKRFSEETNGATNSSRPKTVVNGTSKSNKSVTEAEKPATSKKKPKRRSGAQLKKKRRTASYSDSDDSSSSDSSSDDVSD